MAPFLFTILRSLRAQRTHSFAQRRTLRLWNAAMGGTSSRYTSRDILKFVPAQPLYPTAESTTLALWKRNDKKGTENLGIMTIAEYLKRFAQSGWMLMPRAVPLRDPVAEKTGDSVLSLGGQEAAEKKATSPCYTLKPIRSVRLDNKVAMRKKAKGYKAPHELHISVPTSIGYYELHMQKIYATLLARRNVEVQIHLKRKKKKGRDPALFVQMLAENVHLRPDVILAAMPEKVGFVMNPQTEYSTSGWVMGPPTEGGKPPQNFTDNFYRTKDKVMRQFPQLAEELRLLDQGSPPGESASTIA
ncbi:hypothetical protein LZ554_000479 [Drepanopeziza brunnea f. sp. 'monogermtubi']|nr:hypothetical protein LZ554_000479 [Drepanopeziza brunnea f. sp. 'monogermtubi']